MHLSRREPGPGVAGAAEGGPGRHLQISRVQARACHTANAPQPVGKIASEARRDFLMRAQA